MSALTVARGVDFIAAFTIALAAVVNRAVGYFVATCVGFPLSGSGAAVFTRVGEYFGGFSGNYSEKHDCQQKQNAEDYIRESPERQRNEQCGNAVRKRIADGKARLHERVGEGEHMRGQIQT